MQPILVRRLDSDASRAPRTPSSRSSRGAACVPRWPGHLEESVPGARARRSERSGGGHVADRELLQREDLNPLEEAQGLQRLVAEFGLTHESAAQAVGRSRSAASNLLRQWNLAELSPGDADGGRHRHGPRARALLSLDKGTQIRAATQIAAKKLSVRECRGTGQEAERRVQPAGRRRRAAGTDKSRDLQRVEEELADLLAAEVEVRIKKRSKRGGRVEQSGSSPFSFRLARGAQRQPDR